MRGVSRRPHGGVLRFGRKGANFSLSNPGSHGAWTFPGPQSGCPRSGFPVHEAPTLSSRLQSVRVAPPARPGRCDPSCADKEPTVCDRLEASAKVSVLPSRSPVLQTHFLLLEPGAVQGSTAFRGPGAFLCAASASLRDLRPGPARRSGCGLASAPPDSRARFWLPRGAERVSGHPRPQAAPPSPASG